MIVQRNGSQLEFADEMASYCKGGCDIEVGTFEGETPEPQSLGKELQPDRRVEVDNALHRGKPL